MAEKSRIQLYFHCATCSSGQLAVGWTKEGIQAFCERCDLNVIDLDFKGQKVEFYHEEQSGS